MEASSEVPEKTEYFLLEASLDCQPPTVQVGTPLLDAIALMSSVARGGSPVLPQGGSEPVSRRSSYVLVTENEQLVGILTERDVVRLAAQGADFSACLVDAVMTRQLITLKPSDLKHPAIALNLFRQHRIRHIPVVDGQGHWVGMVTPDSIRQNLQSVDLLRLLRIEESMSKQVVKALPTATVLDLARLMAAHRVSCVVIQQAGPPPQRNPMPVGIVTERDVVQFQALGLNLSALEAQAVMSTPLVCLQPKDTLWTAHESMQRLHVRRLVITDEQGILAGIVTQTSILAALDPLEMQNTIAILHQQVEQLKDERVQWLQTQTRQLENQVADSEQRFQAIFNQTFQFAGLLQLDGTVIEANQTALDFGGLQLEDVIGHPFWEAYWWTISPETQAQLRAAIAQAAQGEFIRYEVEVLGVGQVATIDFSLQPICDGNGQVKWLLPEGRDISDRKQAEMDLRESKQRYANLSQAAPVGIFQTDAEGNCLYVNDRWCQMAGMPPENARGTGWIQGIHPDDRELVFAEWYRATQAKDPFILEYRFQNSEGEVRWVLGKAVAELGADGNPSGYIGTTTDITARVQAEQDLFREKELAQITLHSIADAVITTDALGRVEYFNPVAEQLTGWDAAQAQGQPLGEVFHILHEITRQPAQNPVERALREGCVTGLANHTVLIARDGTEYSIEDSAAPIRDRDGQIIGAIMVFHDVTQSRELQYQLSWQASHDVLTDLPNRRYFEQQLGELLKNIRPCQHVLIYLDLDRFKVVNDTCGHIAGDELLRQIARLLSNQVRATDTLARLGGDEFGILLQQCSLSQAQSLEDV
ncbi:MAG: PAS domain S-box protein [Cyanobacteria bacterium]|nr:PAS domain S-box protein [Cyanobacteriota bacterium]